MSQVAPELPRSSDLLAADFEQVIDTVLSGKKPETEPCPAENVQEETAEISEEVSATEPI